MHTLRQTAAMNLLHASVDITVIALWLGHQTTASTDEQDRYLPHAACKGWGRSGSEQE